MNTSADRSSPATGWTGSSEIVPARGRMMQAH